MQSFDEEIILGIDVGGTKIQSCAITRKGKLLCEPVTVATGGSDPAEEIFSRIVGSAEETIRISGVSKEKIIGIGMGVTGPLDTENGLILECPQLPTMHFYPLRQKMIDRFRLPVYMDNDANALLLGESTWGSGKGYKTTLGFTLGTGLGCAIVHNGKLFTGVNGLAGEIWPSPYENFTIEDAVSGRGVCSIFSGLGGSNASAKEIAILASEGEPKAIEAWNRFGKALGFAVAWGINFIDPAIVIMGGSISNSFDLFAGAMNEEIRKYVCPVPAAKTRIVKAALGDNSGSIGSAAIVLQFI